MISIDMLQIHAQALERDVIDFHGFLLCYKRHERIVYGIVEGHEDPMFYKGAIEPFLPNGWDVELIASGGKEKVLEAYKNMDWSRYPQKRVCFFIDRDLSEFLGGEPISAPNLYVTDNYSIENEIVTFEMMKRVQKELLGVTKINDSEIKILQNVFTTNYYRFREIMAPIMAQILLWRREGKNVSLDNIPLKQFFTFSNGEIKIKPEYASPKDLLDRAASSVGEQASSSEELAVIEIEFRNSQGVEKYIRGKYLLWFFVQCALEIHKVIPRICSAYESPPKPRIPLSYKTAMFYLAPRARCPDSLKDFITGNYVEFIREVDGPGQNASES